MDIIEEKDFREHDKELIEKCIAAINKLPNCPNGHSGTYDKATIERTLRNVIDNRISLEDWRNYGRVN